ncbi:MAG: hypothetical protein J0I09_07810 [Sphingobacteriia bacterium]|nr:hypothetical protein [Sphingobacteriia bacterium]
MDTENFEYLKKQLQSLGFSEKLFPELEQQLLSGSKEFRLHQPKEGDSNTEAVLNFKRSEKNDRAFFNTFDAKFTASDGTTKEHTFYRDKGITLQEADKLFSGESIYKQLRNQQNEPYDAKLKLVYNKEQEKFTLKHTYGKSLQKEQEQLAKGKEEKKEQKQEYRKERSAEKVIGNEKRNRSYSRSSAG